MALTLPGYGEIVTVNLSIREVSVSPTPESLALRYVGGKGIGLRMLCDMTSPSTDPLGPDNPLVLAIGPLTGTAIPFSGKAAFSFKSPQTGVLGESIVGGTLGAALRWVGVTALVVEGASRDPVYLLLTPEGVEVRDARRLWGLGIYETTDLLKEEHGRTASVAAIGPAGENLVSFACVGNEYWRQAGRTGAGAVMGSKRLKAIVVAHDGPDWDAHDPDGVRSLAASMMPRIREGLKSYFERGTPGIVELANRMGFFPSLYWSQGSIEGWEGLSWDALREIFLGPRGCAGCPTPCGRLAEVDGGRRAGARAEVEYETLFALGGLVGVTDVREVTWLNSLADDLGLDTISLGNVLGFAIEARRRGRLDPGFRLECGDSEALGRLTEMIARREGVGDLLAGGVRRAAEALGLEDLAVHVKGLEPSGYDPRTLRGMIVSFGVSSRGACHLRLMGYYADIKGMGGGPDEVTEEKMRAIADLEERGVMMDSLLLCKFSRTVMLWREMAESYRLVTGVDLGGEGLREAARRIIDLAKWYNLREGLGREDDRLPRRLVEEPLRHGGEERRIGWGDVERSLDLYYRIRGWDERGVPSSPPEG